MVFDDYEYVDIDDNKYAVRWSDTLPTQIRTPDRLWCIPDGESWFIKRLAMALQAANAEIEQLQWELDDISRASAH